jgi:hypothetical protein
MTHPWFRRAVHAASSALFTLCSLSIALAQGAKPTALAAAPFEADADHIQERSEWFLRGRAVPGKSAAELRLRAYRTKMQARVSRLSGARARPNSQPALTTWTPLGPVPLASDATGSGFQDYHQVAGRATAVAIDLPIPRVTRSSSVGRKAECGSPQMRQQPLLPM